jgi:hypothetical protein
MQRIGRWIVSTFFFLLIGALCILLWPNLFERVVRGMQHAPGATWAKGVLIFFVTPVVLILLCITILGIPLAVIGGFCYVLLFLVGRLFVGMYLGYELVNEKRFAHKTKQDIIYFIVGFVILSLAMSAPYIGWLIGILASIWGMGGIMHACKRKTG